MPSDLSPLTWVFSKEIPTPEIVEDLLIEGEVALWSFKTVRDSATFTDRRLIIRDAQGVTGKKIEVFTIPYSSILMFSSENAGTLDFTAEVELWTRVGKMKLNLKKDINVRAIDKLLAYAGLVGHLTKDTVDAIKRAY